MNKELPQATEVVQPDAYVEARLTLIEEMFSQLFGFLPPEAAGALASEYNARRAAVILRFHPDSELAKPHTPSRLILPH